MEGWKTIESAPLREAVVIHEASHWNRMGCLLEDGTWNEWPSGEPISYKPTHWLRLPDEPGLEGLQGP